MVVGLLRSHGITEPLGKQIRQVGSANLPGEQRCFVGKISGAVRQRRHWDQSGIDPLTLPGPLIVAEEEDRVLADRAADSAAELILAVEAPFRREEVPRV